MRDFTVHLLFFVLVVVVGFAAGISGALWWDDRDVRVLWLAAGALIVGVLILLLQAVYLAGSPPPRPQRARPRRSSRPTGSAREIAAPSSGTLIQPSDPVEEDDEETKGPAARALRAYRTE